MTKQLKPILHGRDHEHGGPDPVHIVWEDVGSSGGGGGALAGLPWAYVKRRNLTITSLNSYTTVDFDTSNSFVEYGSSGDSCFTLNVASGGNHGIRINENGLYIWIVTFQGELFTTPPAADSVAGAISSLDSGIILAGDYQMNYVPTHGAASSSWTFHCSIVGLHNADPANVTVPYVALASVQQNSGVTLGTCFAHFMLLRLSTITGPNFF